MFTAALFTIAKIWEQPKCPLIDETDVAHVYNEYYSAIRTAPPEILPSVTTWMDGKSIILSEVSQKKTNAIWFYFYVETKKQNKQASKTETDL